MEASERRSEPREREADVTASRAGGRHARTGVRRRMELGRRASERSGRDDRSTHALGERGLRLLGWTASQLLMAEDPLEFLEQIYDRFSEELELDGYFHYQVVVPGETMRLVAWSGISGETAEKLRLLPFGQAVCGTVAATREARVFSRVQESDEPILDFVRKAGFQAYACQPLQVEDRLLGTLSFASRRVDSFSSETLALVGAASDHVAAALDRRQKREALREQATALARSDRQKDQFLAMLGHELRNPLAALDAAVRLLENGRGDTRQLRKVIRSEIEQLTKLVNDLLDVSRITRGVVELRREDVDLGAVASQAVEAVRSSIAERRQELTFVESVPVRTEADPMRVKQIVVNLLSNAARYTDSGGRIRLEMAAEGEEAVLRVIDSGIGIEEGMLENIFEPFIRADRVGDGLGIGLALARSLAELHSGTLTASSEGLGRGSTFTLRLPASRGRVGKDALEDATAGSGFGARRFRLLVVDDHRNSADLLAVLLEADGHAVEVAYTGREAVEKAAAFRPQVILLDLDLPDIDGWQVAAEVRKRDGQASLLALTGFGDEETSRRAQEAGFERRLLKPVELDELRRVLHELRPGDPAGGRRPSGAAGASEARAEAAFEDP